MEDYVVKDHKKLRRGYTTGTCAAAATAAAARLLFLGDGVVKQGPQGEPRGASQDANRDATPGVSQSEALGQLQGCTPGGSRKAAQVGFPGECQDTALSGSGCGGLVEVELTTPNGTPLKIEARAIRPQDVPEGAFRNKGLELAVRDGSGGPAAGSLGQSAVCAVKKDSGDDPDVTDGVLVYARVTLFSDEQGRVLIDGGKGVGRVTKPGLACAVGQAAINPTPRKMIEAEARRAAELAGYEGGISVEISIPAGEELAKRTYNPRLGIEGGISVLGTSGIVEPMSEQALIDTIKVEMNIRKAAGAEYILLTPGNYGETFLKEAMGMDSVYTVKCSNFLGEALDYAVELGFKGLLLTAHIGKLVKVAGGIMNTHSKYGDARMEILAAHAARLGADRQVVEELFSCVTTDDAIAVLDQTAAWVRPNQASMGQTQEQPPDQAKCKKPDKGRPNQAAAPSGGEPIQGQAQDRAKRNQAAAASCGGFHQDRLLEPGPLESGPQESGLLESGRLERGPSELRTETINSILQRIEYHIEERTRHSMETGAVMFSNKYGYLGQTAGADALIRRLRNNE